MENMDFGKDPIPSLFRKMLIPTLLGMVFSAAFVITDGIFVGRGIGSNALAAINVAAPYTFLSIAVGLMFGIGGSVVSSIRLSQKDVKVANIVMTQAFAVSSVILVGVIAVYFLFRPLIINALGASPELSRWYVNIWIMPYRFCCPIPSCRSVCSFRGSMVRLVLPCGVWLLLRC